MTQGTASDNRPFGLRSQRNLSRFFCVSGTRNGDAVLSCIWTQSLTERGLDSGQGQTFLSSAYIPGVSEALHSSPEFTGVCR
jgi:hypothetical protein